MSKKGEGPSVAEIFERYKKVRRERRKHVIKQFFKIKRGAFGFAILVTLTALSLLSPWIAPHPHDFKHAILSRPEWARIFDPSSLGGDMFLVDTDFSEESDISPSVSDIPSIPTGVVYPRFYNPNGHLWPGLSYKLYIDKNSGSKTPGGAAVLEVVDDTRYNLRILPPRNYSYVVMGFSFNIKWEYKVPPYMAYFWFARKYELKVPPLYKSNYIIPAGGSTDGTVNLDLNSRTTFILMAQTNSSMINVTVFSDVQSAKSSSGRNVTLSIDAMKNISFSIRNVGSEEALVSVSVKWAVDRLTEIFDCADSLLVAASLWDPVKKKVMNGSEIKEYVRTKFGVVLHYVDESEGRKTHWEKPIEKVWINESYDRAREQEPATLMYMKGEQDYFFQKGNITVIRIVIKIRYVSEDAIKIRNMMKEPLVIRLFLDDLKVQMQDKYYGIFGTDDKGRDIASMIISGLKISLFVGFTAAFANIFIGVSLGLVAGYKGGRTDEVIMRICDFFMSIPTFPLLLVLSFILTRIGIDVLWAIIIVLSVLGWAGMSRTIRSQVLALRTSVYVEAARASGASSLYIIRKHILPGVWPLVLMYIMVGVVGNILAEAGLTFLGVLVPKWDSLGRMIQEASGISPATGGGGGLSLERFHWLFFPGLVLMLIAYAFYAISDAYDELINPKRRRRF